MSAKILIVDDSATDRLMIKKKLSEYVTFTACDGLEAMRELETHADIDIVILDLDMPNMDGFAVLRALKNDNRYRLRILILTNHEEHEKENQGLRLGAIDYIRKPIRRDSLRARIAIHVELLRMQRLIERKMLENSLKFETIFQQAPIGIAISHNPDPMGEVQNEIMTTNARFEQITGRNAEELMKLGWAQVTHPEDLEEDLEKYALLLKGEINSYAMEKRYIKPDGSTVWVHMVVAPLIVSTDHRLNHICLIQDISERKATEKALAESERSKSVLLANLPGLAFRCSSPPEFAMQYISAGCIELTGYTPEQMLNGRAVFHKELIAPEYREGLRNEWTKVLAQKKP